MEEITKKLYQILEESCNLCESELIALSGGLDSSIISHFLRGKKVEGIAIISEDFVSTDLTYCQRISKETGIPLTIYNSTTSEILEAVENTIKILKNFNDIEIRNNVVMYLAIKWAKDNNKKSIITGDGADELFAGYNFLVNKPEKELESEIKRVCSVMHFPTQKIGKYLGIKIESPFLNQSLIHQIILLHSFFCIYMRNYWYSFFSKSSISIRVIMMKVCIDNIFININNTTVIITMTLHMNFITFYLCRCITVIAGYNYIFHTT